MYIIAGGDRLGHLPLRPLPLPRRQPGGAGRQCACVCACACAWAPAQRCRTQDSRCRTQECGSPEVQDASVRVCARARVPCSTRACWHVIYVYGLLRHVIHVYSGMRACYTSGMRACFMRA